MAAKGVFNNTGADWQYISGRTGERGTQTRRTTRTRLSVRVNSRSHSLFRSMNFGIRRDISQPSMTHRDTVNESAFFSLHIFLSQDRNGVKWISWYGMDHGSMWESSRKDRWRAELIMRRNAFGWILICAAFLCNFDDTATGCKKVMVAFSLVRSEEFSFVVLWYGLTLRWLLLTFIVWKGGEGGEGGYVSTHVLSSLFCSVFPVDLPPPDLILSRSLSLWCSSLALPRCVWSRECSG